MNSIWAHLNAFIIGLVIYLFLFSRFRKSFKWSYFHLFIFGITVLSSYGWIYCIKHHDFNSYFFCFDIFLSQLVFYFPLFILGGNYHQLKSGDVKNGLKTTFIRLVGWWVLIISSVTILYFCNTDSVLKIYSDTAFNYNHKTIFITYVEMATLILSSIAGFTCVYVSYSFFRMYTLYKDPNLHIDLARRRSSLELVRQEINTRSVFIDIEGDLINASSNKLMILESYFLDEISEMESALELKNIFESDQGRIKYLLTLVSPACCFFTLTCTITRVILHYFLDSRYITNTLSLFGKAQIFIVAMVACLNTREFFIFTDRVIILLSTYIYPEKDMDWKANSLKGLFSEATVPLAAASFMNIAIPAYIIVLFPWIVVSDQEFFIFENLFILLKPIYDTSFLVVASFTAIFIAIFKKYSSRSSYCDAHIPS